MPFRFAAVPADRTAADTLVAHLALEAEYAGSVCMSAELNALMEDAGFYASGPSRAAPRWGHGPKAQSTPRIMHTVIHMFMIATIE